MNPLQVYVILLFFALLAVPKSLVVRRNSPESPPERTLWPIRVPSWARLRPFTPPYPSSRAQGSIRVHPWARLCPFSRARVHLGAPLSTITPIFTRKGPFGCTLEHDYAHFHAQGSIWAHLWARFCSFSRARVHLSAPLSTISPFFSFKGPFGCTLERTLSTETSSVGHLILWGSGCVRFWGIMYSTGIFSSRLSTKSIDYVRNWNHSTQIQEQHSVLFTLCLGQRFSISNTESWTTQISEQSSFLNNAEFWTGVPSRSR